MAEPDLNADVIGGSADDGQTDTTTLDGGQEGPVGGRRTTRWTVIAAIATAAALLYAATGPLRGWLVQVLHGP